MVTPLHSSSPGDPVHLVESLKWQVYWFDRYLNRNMAAAPPSAT